MSDCLPKLTPSVSFCFEGRTAGDRQTQRRYIREKGGVGRGRGRGKEGGKEGERADQAPGTRHQAQRAASAHPPFSRTIQKTEEKQGEREEKSRQSLNTAPSSALSV